MSEAFICDAVRTPIGRYGGALATVRADDLAALPLTALMERNPDVDWSKVDDLIYGCANQAGEDNRNVGRMAVLLSGMPVSVPATTVNRLCGSGMDAVGMAARAIRSGDCDLVIAGGVESMSRAPFVMASVSTPGSAFAQRYLNGSFPRKKRYSRIPSCNAARMVWARSTKPTDLFRQAAA